MSSMFVLVSLPRDGEPILVQCMEGTNPFYQFEILLKDGMFIGPMHRSNDLLITVQNEIIDVCALTNNPLPHIFYDTPLVRYLRGDRP